MKKKGIIVGAIAAIIAIAIIASYSSSSSETVNLDMGRTHGTVSTAMGSPILGDASAPITIVEFGDYQCHQCFNWFHNTKPGIYEPV
jgi:protein-disulfide isomerase